MVVIDADGHVEESTSMFSLIDTDYYDWRPMALGFGTDSALSHYNTVWLIDGKAYPNLAGKGGTIFVTPTIMERAKEKPLSIPARVLTDVQGPA